MSYIDYHNAKIVDLLKEECHLELDQVLNEVNQTPELKDCKDFISKYCNIQNSLYKIQFKDLFIRVWARIKSSEDQMNGLLLRLNEEVLDMSQGGHESRLRRLVNTFGGFDV